ncbi:hypothetical protein PSAC2689_70386 [Paraburkholderia sacchari]
MTQLDARQSGTFSIGGDLEVARLGFGALRITGDGSWGPPTDKAEVLRVLRRLPEIGLNFIDTADSYGPDISEWLIKEALHPYEGTVVVATKAGVARPDANSWVPLGRPEYLIQQAEKSRCNLGVERIDLWQLHRLDPRVPADEQYDAVKTLIGRGVVRHAGLSECRVEDIELATRYFPVATVQNSYNLIDRTHEAVLDYCTDRASASFRGVRWRPGNWRYRVRCSTSWRTGTVPASVRSLWPDYSLGVELCSPFQAPARSGIWKKMSLRLASCCPMTTSTHSMRTDAKSSNAILDRILIDHATPSDLWPPALP